MNILTPHDFFMPHWASASKVHDWKNHVGAETAQIWDGFTALQRAAIARDAQARADAEEWD